MHIYNKSKYGPIQNSVTGRKDFDSRTPFRQHLWSWSTSSDFYCSFSPPFRNLIVQMFGCGSNEEAIELGLERVVSKYMYIEEWSS